MPTRCGRLSRSSAAQVGELAARGREEIADGFIRIAVENMANADQENFGRSAAMT